MSRRWIDAAFARGGTSKGLCFKAEDLPGGLELATADNGEQLHEASERPETSATSATPEPPRTPQFRERDRLLCSAMGSPDPYGRQLDGMGGGVSSLSKAIIVDRSAREGVDLDYTFAQVEIGKAAVDYSGNCGNLSSAVVPFALAAGLVDADDGLAHFTLFNTNTQQRVSVRLTVEGGQAAVSGTLELPGVSGTGSPIDLVYPDSGGSRTAGVLPTGSPVDELQVGSRRFRVSLVDAAIPLVLVRAEDLGLTATESPFDLDVDVETMAVLEQIRRAGAVRMGLCADEQSAPLVVPKVTLVGSPRDSQLVDGSTLSAQAADVLVRTISMEQAHRAVPGTGAMCLAAAASIAGTLVADIVATADSPVRLGTPSGVVTAGAVVDAGSDHEPPRVIETSLARTARVLMMGRVAV